MSKEWRKSSRCDSGTCVEVRGRAIRDGKLGDDSPVLVISPAGWSAFIDDIKAGRLG